MSAASALACALAGAGLVPCSPAGAATACGARVEESVVFLSLIFWGWLLGPVGMLLSVPLTIIVKIGLEQTAGGQSIAVLLSDMSHK